MGQLKLKKMTSSGWADLVAHIDKKVLEETEPPHLPGLIYYRDQIIQLLSHIVIMASTKNTHPPRPEPVLPIKFLPFFVVGWLMERGYVVIDQPPARQG